MTADALPHAAVIHTGEGRTRLRISCRRGDSDYFAFVASGLSAMRGVRSVKVTPLTGSVLISHDQQLSRLGAEAEEKGLFALEGGAPTSSDAPATPMLGMNPRLVVAAALGLIALWQVRREKYFPSALSVAMHAAAVAGLFPMDKASPPQD
jgi:hypothetical protein